MPKYSEAVAIIPAAGHHAFRMYGSEELEHPASIPVAGKPFLYWVMQPIITLGISRVCLVLNKPGSKLEELAKLLFGKRLELTLSYAEESAGVGNSVLVGALAFDEKSPTIVVLGDTFFSMPASGPSANTSFVLTGAVEDKQRWCMAKTETGALVELYDKPDADVDTDQALIGVYYFAHGLQSRSPAVYVHARSPATKSLTASKAVERIEMSDILRYHSAREPIQAFQAAQWLDAGNHDHIAEAQEVLLQCRSFNSLSVNRTKGTLTKRSTQEAALYDEINYFLVLPPELRAYFPTLVDHSLHPGKMFLECTFLPAPTLADLYLFSDLPDHVWRKIIGRLKLILDRFHACGSDTTPAEFDSMYFSKNESRLEQFLSQFSENDLRTALLAKNLRVNGAPVIPLSAAFERSRSIFTELLNSAHCGVIHGDLCFGNILCDADRILLKFVDPRGSFGARGIFGDPRYDLAKLSQSIVGLYDVIVADLASLTVQSNHEIELEFPLLDSSALVESLFRAAFCPDDATFEEIRFMEAWLFLSMLPLHADSLKRQMALACRGLSILSELEI